MAVATVLIPTTGSDLLYTAITSVLMQDVDTDAYVIVDGNASKEKAMSVINKIYDLKKVKVCVLPENVGANGFYGHRIYAAFSHLVNTDYVLFLDQDNWFDKTHVSSLIESCTSSNLPWSHSLRKIVRENGEFVCNDDCESLGSYKGFQNYNLVDTNSYCFMTKFITKIASVWHGGWGQDRVFYDVCKKISDGACSKKYTLNYRLGGNEGSVKEQFFIYGNNATLSLYKGKLPWKEKI